jgi:hypothetical protein
VRVEFRQSGGFAGLVRGCELDSADLPPDTQRALERVLREGAAPPAATPPPLADALAYELRCLRGGDELRLRFDERSLSPAQRAVVDALTPLLRPRPLR